MTFPDDTTMFLLLAVHTGQRLDALDGRLTLEVPGIPEPVALLDLDAGLDALEERGWVTIEGDTPATTEQGNYAIGRWLTHKLGRKVVASLAAKSMRATRI